MNRKPEEKFMRRAIELSERGGIQEKTGGVFGAVVVKDGQVIGEGYNLVMKNKDPTAHAEMLAIREAAKHLGSPHLDGCVLYTTGEPCPMCLVAAYWAHIDHVYFASRVEDALEYGKFQDLDFFEEIRKHPQERKIKCTEFMRDDAVAVWKQFAAMPDHVHY